MKEALKSIARVIATVLILPKVLSYRLRALFIGADKALSGSSQSLACIPGLRGQYLRRAFFGSILHECHEGAVIEYGVLFSKAGASIGENAYIGPYCQIGLAEIGSDVLLAPSVHIPSGAMIHGTANPDIPIREQPGTVTLVRIGAGSWIGSGSVVMADVGKGCIIGAGSIVTKPIPDFMMAAGVPAKVIRSRNDATTSV